MRFRIETDEPGRVVSLEEVGGTVFVRVEGLVVCTFEGGPGALVIDDSNMRSQGLIWRHVPSEG
jgi:hypothetical protein